MKIYRVAVIFLSVLFISGCAAGPDYGRLNRQMDAGDCSGVLEHLETNKGRYGSNQKLLYLMDAGMINLRCGNHSEAARYFHRAEELAQDLWTISLSREAASFLWNDYTRPYAGEDFERAMINLMAAISYLGTGDEEAALGEFRRLDVLLTELNEKYDKKNVYREDAFARYMSGILYESDGNMDDAFIAYLKAYEIFTDYKRYYATPPPPALLEDLCRVGALVHRMDDVVKAGIEPDAIDWDNPFKDDQYGKVVFVGFKGAAPRKVSDGLILPTSAGPVKMAFPRYVVTPPGRSEKMLLLESGESRFSARAHIVQDINKIAVKNLEDRQGRYVVRMLARTAAKQVAINRIASEANSDALMILLNFANIFVERADTRSWQTLPGEMHMARMFVPSGTYRAYALSGGVGKTHLETVEIKPGRTRFIFQMM
jgi:uncharacterized protein